VLLFVNTVTYFSNNIHRRDAKGTEGIYFYLPLIRPTDWRAGRTANQNPLQLLCGTCIPFARLWEYYNWLNDICP